jgi:hypothetical protein
MARVDQVILWKQRAIEARALAGLMDTPHAKRQMLEVADQYEKLALRDEARDRPSIQPKWRVLLSARMKW